MVRTRQSAEKTSLELEASNAEKTKQSARRESRRQQRDMLKQKSTGVGLIISTDTPKSSSRKLFTESDEENETQQLETLEATKSDTNQGKYDDTISEEDDEDDDDDAVEEVQTTDARKRLELERKIEIKSSSLLNAKKRKRKHKDQPPELDDAFFQQLDQERKQHQITKDEPKKSTLGKHTTFVVEGELPANNPVAVDDTIEVVVLNTVRGPSAVVPATGVVSEQAKVFSRSRLGDDDVKEVIKKGRTPVPTWKRSKKMNRLIMAKQNRQGHKSNAAPVFAVTMKY
jgi:hypothetical protein